jgi:hypothetical protein
MACGLERSWKLSDHGLMLHQITSSRTQLDETTQATVLAI